MKRFSYRDRDYSFGQAMLTLRATIGITQSELADVLGVSRRTVGAWEAGSKYPKAEHLKKFIAFAIQHRAFPAGNEAEEIRVLWRAAHQKVLLNQAWLNHLLASMRDEPNASTAISSAQTLYTLHRNLDDRGTLIQLPTPSVLNIQIATEDIETFADIVPVQSPRRGRRDWDDAVSVSVFYGRETELDLLTKWVVEEHCRVVSVLGLGGIGKSALTITLMHRIAGHFDIVIWRSMRDNATCESLLDELLRVLGSQEISQQTATFERRLSTLLEHMRSNRILLVLDNLESVMQEGENAGSLLPGYAGFREFLRKSAETLHQSCILLTSREKLSDLVPLEGSRTPVRALRLARLDAESSEKLLVDKGVGGSPAERAQLIEAYTGNPLALKIVSQTIVDLFDGEISPFLEHGEVIFGGIRGLLNQQFARLTRLEQSVLLWLAILREPSTLNDLLSIVVTPVQRGKLLEAVESLHRSSLIERGSQQGNFTLQSVVLEYMTARIITEACDEIQSEKPGRISIEHGFELATSREYIREIQAQKIVAPILEGLRSMFPQPVGLERQLLRLVAQLAVWDETAQGYGPANLVTLLRTLRGDLRGLNLSGLVLRGVYLQGIDMQDADFSRTMLRDSIFSEVFDMMTAVAVSSTGNYWAASSRHGEIRVWEAGGHTLHLAWRAHADMIWTLDFSPDGMTLVSASWDGSLKVWDIVSGALLWTARHTSHVNRVAFSPNGAFLVSCGNDAVMCLWNARTGALIEALPHPDVVNSLAWSPEGRHIATGDLKGCVRLWTVDETGATNCILTLAQHANCVEGLSFSPDGTMLASGSWDGTVKLWRVPNGDLWQVLTGHTDRVTRVAWSPDGQTLASSSRDQTIWLWSLTQAHNRAVLRGHVSSVSGLAFTADNHNLVSCGEDGTLRVWDMSGLQCVRVIQGYAAALYDVDWSPDGKQLVSSGTDYLVAIYTVEAANPPRILRGHTGVVYGVGWSPNDRWLASSEWDNAIRLWDPISGDCHYIQLQPDYPDNYFYGLAWSPDGERLAGGTYRRGVLVWDVTLGQPSWTGEELSTWIRQVAWSPGGDWLAGGGDDGVIYVWAALPMVDYSNSCRDITALLMT